MYTSNVLWVCKLKLYYTHEHFVRVWDDFIVCSQGKAKKSQICLSTFQQKNTTWKRSKLDLLDNKRLLLCYRSTLLSHLYFLVIFVVLAHTGTQSYTKDISITTQSKGNFLKQQFCSHNCWPFFHLVLIIGWKKTFYPMSGEIMASYNKQTVGVFHSWESSGVLATNKGRRKMVKQCHRG